MRQIYYFYFIIVAFLCSCVESNPEREPTKTPDYSYTIPDSSVIGCWKLTSLKITNYRYDLNGIPLPKLKSNHLKYLLSKSDSMVFNFQSNYDVNYNGFKIAEWSIKPNGIYLLQTGKNASSPIILNAKYDYIFNEKSNRQLVTTLYNESSKPLVSMNYLLVRSPASP